jgi:hypothetical protein
MNLVKRWNHWRQHQRADQLRRQGMLLGYDFYDLADAETIQRAERANARLGQKLLK